MSRLVKAIVGGACLAAGFVLLGYSAKFLPPKLEPGVGRPAVVKQTPGKPLAKSAPTAAERQKPDQSAPAEVEQPEEPKAVERPLEAPGSADLSELLARPDENGLLTFSFNGQTWAAVFEWLADVSRMSLQWEEAPAGYFTYATRKPCTVAEARDKINSVLLSKGFTLLRNGNVLIVANLTNLDPSLAPRVTVDELATRDKHELVQTFVDLDSIAAETAAEEIEPLLGSYGKVAALTSTNRLELLDTVENLQQIIAMIDEEQSSAGRQKLVAEFRLKYVRAAEALKILQSLLGIEPNGDRPADQQTLAAAQMLLQFARPEGPPGGPLPDAAMTEESQVNLAVNSRTNSILAHAPPDKMAVIRQAISIVDVPQYSGQSPLTSVEKMQVYRVAAVSPDVLVKILKEHGGLDPMTQLEIDAKNRTIVAFAPSADHALIRMLIDKIDGTGRRFEVIQLHLLNAEYVAGSIHVLMNGPERTDAARDRYPPYYYYDLDEDDDLPQPAVVNRFQVEADVERNRLLLWANEGEVAEVKTLLMKLGEIALKERNGLTTRMIRAAPGEDTEKLLERLQEIWPTLAPNPLDVRLDAADPAGAPTGTRTKLPSNRSRPQDEDDDAPSAQR